MTNHPPSKKRILFVGCSFTAVNDNGFSNNKQFLYHWPWLLARHLDVFFYNAGVGGMSNEEIFHRTIENVINTNYDLVVVMWSSIGRHWGYHSVNNVDDFTICNSEIPEGLLSWEANQYTKLRITYFNNLYVELKKWLNYIISLDVFLTNQKQKFIFIKSFENYLSDFASAKLTSNGFVNIDNIKELLDFDHRPDYYINEKLQNIKTLMSHVDTSHWLNFDTASYHANTVDYADDNSHPGILSNQQLFLELVEYCKQRFPML